MRKHFIAPLRLILRVKSGSNIFRVILKLQSIKAAQ